VQEIMNENLRYDPYSLYYIGRAYGTVAKVGFIFNGLKPVVTRCFEPTAIDKEQTRGRASTNIVTTDFNPLKKHKQKDTEP
jgi:hypothetical protein